MRLACKAQVREQGQMARKTGVRRGGAAKDKETESPRRGRRAPIRGAPGQKAGVGLTGSRVMMRNVI